MVICFRCYTCCGKWAGKPWMQFRRSDQCWSHRVRRPSDCSFATGSRPLVSGCSPATNRTCEQMRLSLPIARNRPARHPVPAPCSGRASSNANRRRRTWNGLRGVSCSCRWTWPARIRCTRQWSPSKDICQPAKTVS